MAMLNIPTTVDDPAYRYKMPRIISKKEGRGNGSKTCIMNMGDVAAALKRQPTYCCKFFGYELGAMTSYTNKDGEGERTIINGHHETKVFQDLLDKFIEKYVLCPNCNLPEIDIEAKKGGIHATCKACGWKGELDSTHRVATFIIKNPPDEGPGFADREGGKKTREQRQKERAEKQRKAEEKEKEDEDGDEDEDEDDTSEKKAKKKKEKKDKKEKKEKKVKKEKERDEDDDKDDDEDEKKEKKKKEKKEKKEKEKKEKKDKKEKKKEKKDKKDKSSDEEEDEEEDKDDVTYGSEELNTIVHDMTAFVKKKGPQVKAEDLMQEVRVHQVTKGFDNSVRMYVLLSALFPDGAMTAKAVGEKSKLINHFISNGQMGLPDWIWAFDAYIDANPQAAKQYPHVLKALYDDDIAEEEDLLRHYNAEEDASRRKDPGFEAALNAAKPFLKWLESADAEDDDEDEEDDEDDEDENDDDDD